MRRNTDLIICSAGYNAAARIRTAIWAKTRRDWANQTPQWCWKMPGEMRERQVRLITDWQTDRERETGLDRQRITHTHTWQNYSPTDMGFWGPMPIPILRSKKKSDIDISADILYVYIIGVERFSFYHGFSVTVSVRFGIFRENRTTKIKIKKIRTNNQTTSNNRYFRYLTVVFRYRKWINNAAWVISLSFVAWLTLKIQTTGILGCCHFKT